MKVVIIGCGAVGLNYGMRLLEKELCSLKQDSTRPLVDVSCGKTSRIRTLDVNFVLRRDYELVKQTGLKFTSSRGNSMDFSAAELTEKLYLDTTELAAAKGNMEWIIIAVKSYSITEELRDSIALVHRQGHTNILVVMNGLGVEAKFAEWFGPERIFGGISYAAINRGPNPPAVGSGEQGSTRGRLVVTSMGDGKLEVGHCMGDADQLGKVAALFAGSKEEPYLEVKSCLLAARWHKLVFNLVFSGIGVAMGGVAVDVVVRDPALVEIANRVITNTVYVANIDIQAHVQAAQGASKEMNDSSAVTDTSAAGLGVADTYTASNACESGGSYPHLLDCEAVRAEVWRKSKGSGPYRTSAVIDLLEGRQLEMHSLFLAPIQRAEALGVPLEKYASLSDLVLMVQAAERLALKRMKENTYVL